LGSRDHILLLLMHHSISDGWSLGILFQELEICYNAYASNSVPALKPLTVQYADYARWQRTRLNDAALEKELSFWQEYLAGAPQELEFPGPRPRGQATLPKATAGRYSAAFSGKTVRQTWELARRLRATPFMVWGAALAITLHQHTGQQDLVLGTVIAGRTRREFENLIGCFMNFLPIRVRLQESDSGEDVLQKVRTAVLQAQTHQDCPFEKIVSALNPRRENGRNPFYNVGFLWQHFPRDAGLKISSAKATQLPVHTQTPLLDLRFEAEHRDRKWFLICEYDECLFDEKVIASLLDSFSSVLEHLVAEPKTLLELIGVTDRQGSSRWKKIWQRLTSLNREERSRPKASHQLVTKP
jgi:hypothetical protein